MAAPQHCHGPPSASQAAKLLAQMAKEMPGGAQKNPDRIVASTACDASGGQGRRFSRTVGRRMSGSGACASWACRALVARSVFARLVFAAFRWVASLQLLGDSCGCAVALARTCGWALEADVLTVACDKGAHLT